MEFVDTVFGKQTITEPVILSLIESPALQRLRGIDQCGYPGPFFPELRKHTRFEHSLGVYFLLRQFHAPIEEQVAGLLHDVSHSAFSHAIDYVFGDEATQAVQSYQDDAFEPFLQQTQIPEILHAYGLQFHRIVDDANFPLKEQSLPDLCADRIDYCLRTAIAGNDISPDEANNLLQHLKADTKRWWFQEKKYGRQFAELFSTMNKKYYCAPVTAAMFHSIKEVLQYALLRNYLTKQDLYETDDHVLKKITSYMPYDQELQVRYDRMTGGSACNHGPYRLILKSRAVDPLCYDQGEIVRLSAIDDDWHTRIVEESRPKEYAHPG